jgi:polyisoprenoid-binding protein YceI
MGLGWFLPVLIVELFAESLARIQRMRGGKIPGFVAACFSGTFLQAISDRGFWILDWRKDPCSPWIAFKGLPMMAPFQVKSLLLRKGMDMRTRFNSMALVLALLLGSAGWVSADTFKLDPAHSEVVFQVEHMGVSKVFGRFDAIQGTFSLDDDASKVSFEATIPAESVDTGVAPRDKHLKSADFFNAKQFPDITFKSTAVKKSGDSFEVTGDLTLHGVTKSITVTLAKVGQAEVQGKERAGFDGQFTVNRSDYGMTFMVGPVGDEISLWINLEGVKQ